MDAKYEVLGNSSIRARFETGAEVVAYRLEHADAIAAYNASQAASQPVSRDTPTKLGAILLGIEEPEPAGEKIKPVAKWLLDTQTINLMRATFA